MASSTATPVSSPVKVPNVEVGGVFQEIDLNDENLLNHNNFELANRRTNSSKVHLNIEPPFEDSSTSSSSSSSSSSSTSSLDHDSGVVSDPNTVSSKDDLKKMTKDIEDNDNGEEKDVLEKVFCAIGDFLVRFQLWVYLVCFVGYNIFFGFAIKISWHRTETWCSGVKLLTILTTITYASLLYYLLIKPYLFVRLYKRIQASDSCAWYKVSPKRQNILRIATWMVVIAAIVAVVVSSAWKETQRFYSAGGYLVFILIGWIFSKHRSAIKWNQILWGLTMQMTFGIIVLRTEFGKMVFQCIGDKVNAFLGFTTSGTDLVFGWVANGVLKGPAGNVTIDLGTGNQTFFLELPLPVQNSIFAFSSMPVVIFFSFFVSILYYYGIMQVVVKKLGWLLQITIGTTACESISASGNIFLGMTESPLLIRPFLPMMTKSELHAVLTGGFATIAGAVMAAYISFGISASHLLSASVMAAPSALALSKLFYPETEVSKTSANDIQLAKGTERTAIEAGANGAATAVKLVANIMANLIAFMAFLAFLDSLIGWIGDMVDVPQLSFKLIMSKIFIPLALLLGIEWDDAEKVASLLGLKMVINEFVAYQELSTMLGSISARSETIATFALCSFANIASIGIQVGGLSAMAPARKSDLAQIAVRAMITGSVASFMTACVAGMLS